MDLEQNLGSEESVQNLFSEETFLQVCAQYGYGGDFQDVVAREFPRIKGVTYLDHAGATLFPESLLRDYFRDISTNVYGNPHSRHPSSRLTHDTVERVRDRVLQHFNTTSEEHSVVFTSGCTAALKLVAESFPWRRGTRREAGSCFAFLTDSHTSVVGMRGLTSGLGVTTLPVAPEQLRSSGRAEPEGDLCRTPHLFCFPAQSNFSGRKYPLSHVRGIQERTLRPASDLPGRWFVLLDAASYVGCSPLDLRRCPADFVCISFYKMFGFPTGLGALLVRNAAAGMLRKAYFGGGTAAAYLPAEDYYVPAESVSDRFEDGTVSFLDIIALKHGFDSLLRITGNMHNIQRHTFGLARHTYMLLSCLRHGNGRPAAQIYTEGQFESPAAQGAILNFSLLDSAGRIIGYSQVDRMAALYNIHVRTGCFCNTGACQQFLGITDQQLKNNLQAGHVCGDSVDMVDGRPTGSVRVSFGYMSTFEDCQNFLNFVVECFVEKPVRLDRARLQELQELRHRGAEEETLSGENLRTPETNSSSEPRERPDQEEPKVLGDVHTLTNIFIYPVKSCAALEVQEWPLGPLGLLYDRLWMVVNGNGVCLSQKREARLCLIQPELHLDSNRLLLRASGMDPVCVPLECDVQPSQVCRSKVCGDRVDTLDCGDEVASWLSEFLGQTCRLIRQSPDSSRGLRKTPDEAAASSRLSLVNEAQYLMINRGSVELLHMLTSSRLSSSEANQLLDTENVVRRFRANLVIAGAAAFQEDNWSHVIIGDCRFTVTGPCHRCQVVGIDQETGTRTKELLLSLSAHRTHKVTFGVYLSRHSSDGSAAAPVLSVGSLVQPETPS